MKDPIQSVRGLRHYPGRTGHFKNPHLILQTYPHFIVQLYEGHKHIELVSTYFIKKYLKIDSY